MFKARTVEVRLVPGPHRFEAHTSCAVDVSPEAAWERVADLSIALAGDTSHVASGLLPGHTMGLGALAYQVRRAENGMLDGTIAEVVAWDPPRRFAVRALQETSDRVTAEAAWRVDAQGESAAVIHYAVRIEILVPADPQRFAELQAKVDRQVAETGARVPHSLA